MNKKIFLIILLTINAVFCENNTSDNDKKSNNTSKYIIGTISATIAIGLGYIGYKYYKKNYKNLVQEIESDDSNKYIYKSLKIQYGSGKFEKPPKPNTLDKKSELQVIAKEQAKDALNLLKEIAEDNQLPDDHIILKTAQDIYNNTPGANTITIADLESVHEDDREDVLNCIRLLNTSMKNIEAAFKYICLDNRKRTTSKINKKTKRIKIGSGVYKPPIE